MNKWFSYVDEGACLAPCTQFFRKQGLSVGHIRPYRRVPIRIRGGPSYTSKLYKREIYWIIYIYRAVNGCI